MIKSKIDYIACKWKSAVCEIIFRDFEKITNMVKSSLKTMLWLDIGVCTHFELFCDGIRIRCLNHNGLVKPPIMDVALSNPFPECVVKFLEI